MLRRTLLQTLSAIPFFGLPKVVQAESNPQIAKRCGEILFNGLMNKLIEADYPNLDEVRNPVFSMREVIGKDGIERYEMCATVGEHTSSIDWLTRFGGTRTEVMSGYVGYIKELNIAERLADHFVKDMEQKIRENKKPIGYIYKLDTYVNKRFPQLCKSVDVKCNYNSIHGMIIYNEPVVETKTGKYMSYRECSTGRFHWSDLSISAESVVEQVNIKVCKGLA